MSVSKEMPKKSKKRKLIRKKLPSHIHNKCRETTRNPAFFLTGIYPYPNTKIVKYLWPFRRAIWHAYSKKRIHKGALFLYVFRMIKAQHFQGEKMGTVKPNTMTAWRYAEYSLPRMYRGIQYILEHMMSLPVNRRKPPGAVQQYLDLPLFLAIRWGYLSFNYTTRKSIMRYTGRIECNPEYNWSVRYTVREFALLLCSRKIEYIKGWGINRTKRRQVQGELFFNGLIKVRPKGYVSKSNRKECWGSGMSMFIPTFPYTEKEIDDAF